MSLHKKKAGWGGKREGAGRKRELTFLKRREIANHYYELTQSLSRLAAIRELATTYKVTPRLIDRCLAEFRPQIRWNKQMFKYATEGMNEIGRLPEREIEVKKLKPGVYCDDKGTSQGTLRLIIDDDGNRKWLFRFQWGRPRYIYSSNDPDDRILFKGLICDMVLGDSKMSLAKARAAAEEASRKRLTGENPIDGSWETPALESAAAQRAKSRSDKGKS